MEERARRIVETAVELAEKGGFEAVRLRDVAASSGVALGTLYRHFSSKEDLLIAGLAQQVELLGTRMAAHPAVGNTPVERVNDFFAIATTGLCRRPMLARAILRSVASAKPDLTEKVASFHGSLPLGVAAQGEGADVTARIAVYHGEDDVLIPDEAVAAFKAEMDKTGADCLFVPLPTALHGFSNTVATGNGEKYGLPLRYDQRADDASWNHMQLLLQSAFK